MLSRYIWIVAASGIEANETRARLIISNSSILSFSFPS